MGALEGNCCFQLQVPSIALLLGPRSEEMKKAVLAELDRLRKEAKLFTFEHAAKIYLESEPFSVENDILTPTFKLKRDIAKKVYETQIDAMYDSLGRVGKQG